MHLPMWATLCGYHVPRRNSRKEQEQDKWNERTGVCLLRAAHMGYAVPVCAALPPTRWGLFLSSASCI